MSQNTTESQDRASHIMSLLSTNLPTSSEKIQPLQNLKMAQLHPILEYLLDCNLLCKSRELRGFTSYALLNDQALKSLQEILKLISQHESPYAFQLVMILKPLLTNSGPSPYSGKVIC